MFRLSVPPSLTEQHGRSVFLKQRQPESAGKNDSDREDTSTTTSGEDEAEHAALMDEDPDQLTMPVASEVEDAVAEIASAALGDDPGGHRKEFLELVAKAKQLSGR